jgi:hypothetical protein
MPSADGATPTIVLAAIPPRAGGGGRGAAASVPPEAAGMGPLRRGLGPVRRAASSGGSTWNDVPHLGQRIFSPDAGTLRSSTW